MKSKEVIIKIMFCVCLFFMTYGVGSFIMDMVEIVSPGFMRKNWFGWVLDEK